MIHEDEPLFDPDELDQTDIDRYEAAAGWQPKTALARRDENDRRPKVDPWDPGSHETMLETRPAVEWQTRTDPEGSPELFRDIWHEGEVAVLLGGRGSYKSIFAVQLAENLARGHNAGTRPPLPARRILYFDFQRTQAQWTERYSSPPDGTRRRRKRYSFSRNFERTALAWDGHVPEFCKGDLQRFLEHSIMSALDETEARVIIIDDISYLVPSPTPAALTKIMKTLRLWRTTYNLSILVLSSPPCTAEGTGWGLPAPERGVDAARGGIRGGSPVETAMRRSPLTQLPDSAFALLPSTFGPNYRYLKHLMSTRPITHDASNVISLRLKRMSEPPTGVPAAASASGVAKLAGGQFAAPEASTAGTRAPLPAGIATEHTESTESANRQRPTANCFLGLELVGPATEHDHLRDYESHLKPAIRVDEATRLKRLRSGPIVDILLSPEYKRYLKGE